MTECSDKFAAMIGFAKRAGKIVYGYDELRQKRNVKLLAVSDTASQNLLDGMTALAQKRDITLVRANALEELVGKGCKALGITDINMAKAMKDFASSGYPRYSIQSE